MESYLSKIIEEAAANLQKQKDELLFKRVCERVKTNEPIDLKKEGVRRFPRIKCEFDSTDQSEHWYWNDGSIKGLHLISFYNDFNNQLPFTPDGQATIRMSYK